MQFDTDIHDAVRRAVEAFPADIGEATERAVCLIRDLPATAGDHANRYEEIAADLARHAVQNLVYLARHHITNRTKREAGAYGRPAKVRVGESRAVQQVERACWDRHFIGSKLLGDVTGKEIADLIGQQRSQQRGARVNEEILCYAQSQGITPDATIREFFRSRRRRERFEEAYGRINREVWQPDQAPGPDQAA